MSTLATLMVALGVDMTEFDRGISRANELAKKVGTDMKGSFEAVGGALTVGVTAPLVAMGAAGLKAFGDFEGAMNKVKALGGITGESFDKLKNQAMDLGAQTQFSAKQAADAMGVFAGAGFKADQIYAAMPGTLNLAAAGQLAVGRAAEITKDLLGQFGLAASDSTRVADLLAQAGSEASGSLNDIAESLKYAGPIAKTAGLSIDETTSAIVLLDQAGIRGSEAGTGLRGVLAGMAEQAPATAKAMKAAGVDISALHDPTKTFADRIEALRDEFSQIQDPTERMGTLIKLFGRESASAAAILIDQGGPALDNMTKKLNESGGAAQRQAEILNSGLNGALEKMSGSVETAAIAIGEQLAPHIIRLAGFLETTANKAAEFLKWFNTLPQPVKDFTIGLAALAAATGPMILGVTKVIDIVEKVGPAFQLVGTAFNALKAVMLANPYVAIAAATIAIVALIVTNWDTIKDTTIKVFNTIKKWLSDVWGDIRDAASTAMKSFLAMFTQRWESILQFLRELPARVKTIAGNIISGLVKGIMDGVAAVGNALRTVGDNAIKGLKDLLGIRSPSRVMAEVGSDISAGLALGIASGTGEVTGAVGSIGTAIQGKLKNLDLELGNIALTVSENFGLSSEKLGKSVQGVVDGLGSLLNPLDMFGGIIDRINPIGTIMAAMFETLEPIIKAIQEPLKVMGQILAILIAPVLKLVAPLLWLFAKVIGVVAKVVAAIWNAIASVINFLLGWLGVKIALIDTADIDKVLNGETAKDPSATTAKLSAPAQNLVARAPMTLVLELDGREITRRVLEYMPGEMRLNGVTG